MPQVKFASRVHIPDGEPIGLTHYLFHRHGWRVENVCYLQDLYVDAELRGTGAGRALIEAVYARQTKPDAATCIGTPRSSMKWVGGCTIE